MKTLKFTAETAILAGAFGISFLFALSMFNFAIGVTSLEAVVGGQSPKTYGVQFNSQNEPVDLTDAPQVLLVQDYTATWMRPIQPTPDDYLQNTRNPQEVQ